MTGRAQKRLRRIEELRKRACDFTARIPSPVPASLAARLSRLWDAAIKLDELLRSRRSGGLGNEVLAAARELVTALDKLAVKGRGQ